MTTRWSKVETEKLGQMRQILGAQLGRRAQLPDVVGDRRLLRFLRGHGGNLEKACQMYTKFLEFRDVNNVDDIRNDILFGHKNKIKTPFDFPCGRKILDLVPQIVISATAMDKKRNPLSTETFGFNPESILKNVTREEYTIFMIYMLEYKILVLEQLAHERERAMKKHLDATNSESTVPYGLILSCFIIRDFNAFTLGHMGSDGKTVMKWILEIAVNNYPETQFKCHMINIPWYFNTIWFFIKNLLDANILSKLTISTSSDYFDKLQEDIARENIPVSMGGSYTGYNEEFVFDLSESGPFYYAECPFMKTRQLQASQLPMSGVTKKGVPVLKKMITDDYFDVDGPQTRKKKDKRGSTGSQTSDVTTSAGASSVVPPTVVAAPPPAFMPIASNHNLIVAHESSQPLTPQKTKKHKLFSKKKVLRMFGIHLASSKDGGGTPSSLMSPAETRPRGRSSSFDDLNNADVPATPMSDSGVLVSRPGHVEKQLSTNLKGEYAVIESPVDGGSSSGNPPQRTHSLPSMDEFLPVTAPVVPPNGTAFTPTKSAYGRNNGGASSSAVTTPKLKPLPGESIKDWQERNRRASAAAQPTSQVRLALVPADAASVASTTTNEVESLLTRDTSDRRTPAFHRNPHLQDGPVKQKTTTCIAEDTACVVATEWWCF